MGAKNSYRVDLPGLIVHDVSYSYGEVVVLKSDDRVKGLVRGGWLVPLFDNPKTENIVPEVIEDKIIDEIEVSE